MTIYRERMTRIPLAPFLSYATGWTMRVWREEKLDTHIFPAGRVTVDNDVIVAIGRFAQMPVTQLELAKGILDVSRVNAVEIVDMSGFGEVLYKDWP